MLFSDLGYLIIDPTTPVKDCGYVREHGQSVPCREEHCKRFESANRKLKIT